MHEKIAVMFVSLGACRWQTVLVDPKERAALALAAHPGCHAFLERDTALAIPVSLSGGLVRVGDATEPDSARWWTVRQVSVPPADRSGIRARHAAYPAFLPTEDSVPSEVVERARRWHESIMARVQTQFGTAGDLEAWDELGKVGKAPYLRRLCLASALADEAPAGPDTTARALAEVMMSDPWGMHWVTWAKTGGWESLSEGARDEWRALAATVMSDHPAHAAAPASVAPR